MGRKNKQNGNDAERYFNQRVRNPPRLRVKGNLGQNTVLTGTEVCDSLTTSSTGTAHLVVPLIGGSGAGLDPALSPLQNVAKLYNSFLFHSSAIQYIPSVGLNSPGNISISFINNAETVFYALEPTRTTADLKTICLGQANCVSHPVWHEFSYPMRLPARRKRFDCNSTSPIGSVDVIDRDCQGAFIIIITGADASKLVSTPRRTSKMLVEGLSVNIP